MACGKITDPAAFSRLAENGVTRYCAAGLAPLDAARKAEAGSLPIQTRLNEIR